MFGFIQYYSKSIEKVEVKFLCLENVFVNFDKVDFEIIIGVFFKVIEKYSFNFKWFKSFVLDGVSVMVGERLGVVIRLKVDKIIQFLIFVYCVCYKLVLVCIDILNDFFIIKQV